MANATTRSTPACRVALASAPHGAGRPPVAPPHAVERRDAEEQEDRLVVRGHEEERERVRHQEDHGPAGQRDVEEVLDEPEEDGQRAQAGGVRDDQAGRQATAGQHRLQVPDQQGVQREERRRLGGDVLVPVQGDLDVVPGVPLVPGVERPAQARPGLPQHHPDHAVDQEVPDAGRRPRRTPRCRRRAATAGRGSVRSSGVGSWALVVDASAPTPSALTVLRPARSRRRSRASAAPAPPWRASR